jgi:hypothetical protein
MVDLLVLTSLEELLFILKILLSFFTKQATLIRRSTVLSLLSQLIFPEESFLQQTLTLLSAIYILNILVQKTHKIGQSSDYQSWAENPF